MRKKYYCYKQNRKFSSFNFCLKFTKKILLIEKVFQFSSIYKNGGCTFIFYSQFKYALFR